MQQKHKLVGDKPTAGLRRVSLQNALRSVLGAAWRIHHYRDIHSRMMDDALRSLECRPPADRCGNKRQSCASSE